MRFDRYLRVYCRPRKLLACAALCGLLGLIPAAQIYAQSGLIDAGAAGLSGGPAEVFVLHLLGYCGLLLGESVIRNLLQRITERHRLSVGSRLDTQRLEKANRTAYPITETQRFHDLLAKSGKAPEQDAKCFEAMQTILTNALRILSVLAVIWFVDVWTVVCMVVLLCAGVALNVRLARRTDRYMENMRRTDYFASMLLQREYAGERKLFAYDDEISARFSRSFAKARAENETMGRRRFSVEALLQVLSVVYSAAVILLLLRPLMAGSITIGVFTSVFYSAAGLQSRCNQLYDGAFQLVGNFRQMQSYFSFMALEEEPRGGSDSRISGAPSIEFDHVGFTYPGAEKPVLTDVSFRLEPGRHYALVGENGCGKTTLVKLMSGLYTPTKGEIRIGGKPLGALTREEEEPVFFVVFQDFYRYPLTVRENVSLGSGGPLPDDALDEIFGALDFHPAVLSGDKGADCSLLPLQKTGAGLSGGEWQKLAIARCVASPAPVAILDEPNAALDPIAEAAVYQAYRELLAEKTTLFISHRLGSVRMAEQILVLRDGKMSAMDSHRELMENCGYYADLFNTQRAL